MSEETTGSKRSSISRRDIIKRGAIVGGVALWAPPIVQSIRAPAMAQTVSGPPCIVTGDMTGGGFVTAPSGVKVSYDLRKLDCPPQTSPPELKVSWTVGTGKNKVTYVFELLTFTSRTCVDNPSIPNSPDANFDTVVGTGTGTLTVNGVDQNGTIQFGFIDNGEGANSLDTVTLIINDAANNNVMTINNQLVEAGNLQAHGNFAIGRIC